MKHKYQPVIRMEKASYLYHGTIPALTGVDLEVGKGEMLAIIGPNGSGKSTLLQLMCGLTHPSSGRVFFYDDEVSEARLKNREFQRMFRSRVGYVFQNSEVQLFCPTVIDELLFGPLQLGIPLPDAQRRAEEIMEMLAIAPLRDRPSHMLSGGERKRVAIGSSLTMNPEVLLLDEPTTGLDPKTEAFLTDLVFTLNDSGKTVVLATHNLELVAHLEPRIAVLSEDHVIVRQGTTEEVLGDRDFLRQINLIHEHVHRHGKRIHKHLHSHFLFHDHEK